MRRSTWWGRVLIATAALVASAASAAVLSISPSTKLVDVGQTFSLDVSISEVTDLYAYQFDIQFDPLLLSAISVQEGAFLPSGGSTFFVPGSIDNTSGTIALTADTLSGAVPGVTGSGVLATLSFQSLATGVSSVAALNVLLLDSSLADISTTVSGSRVTVQQTTPEPGTLALLGLGIAGLAVARRRKQ